MRPHRLAMTAFGPFAGTEVVAVDALAEQGLFLLHGETGAGKTTVLDAIGYALYGVVPGARQGARHLRSDHAVEGVRTSVELEFTVRGRRLRIRRSPEQQRPKARGSGTTTEPASVLLHELVGDTWSTVSTRVGEADEELLSLMGMSAEQFFQVVLLPQGDFARFLRARADERGKLLQQLFATGRFSAVESWLADLRVASDKAAREVEGDLGLVAARLAQAAGETSQPDSPDDQWAEQLVARASHEAVCAAGATEAAEVLLAERATAAAVASDLARRQASRWQVLTAAAELAATADDIRLLRRQVEAARRAAPVLPLLQEWQRGEAEAGDAADDERRARSVLVETGQPGGGDLTVLRTLADQLREEGGRLGELLRVAAEVVDDEQRLAALRVGAEQARARAHRATRTVAGLPARRAELAAVIDPGRIAAAGLPALREQVARDGDRAEAAQRLAQQDLLVQRLTDDAQSSRQLSLDAREALLALRGRRIEGMAAELAAGLEPQGTCPVCGSTDHPDPTEAAPDAVTADQEEQAQLVVDNAARALDAARNNLSQATQLRAELRAVTGSGSVPGLRTAAVRSADRLGEAERLAAAVPVAEALLQELAAEDQQAQRDRVAGECDAAAAEAAATELSAKLAARRHRLDAARGEDLSVPARAARLTRGAEAAAAAAEAAARARSAAVRVRRAREALDGELAAAGFPDPAALSVASRAEEVLATADARCREHDLATAGVTQRLSDPDLDVPMDPEADVTGAQERWQSVRERARVAAERTALTASRVEELSGPREDLQRMLATLAPLRHRAREVRALADLVAGQGDNAMHMTLSAFVLAARLEEVAEVASQRLLRMTGGRYALVHTDARAARGARSGLGLLARDTWSGVDRDTATLSGGETFLASLALALGLADVVTAEAGGAGIDTLLVDEGFGSLDPEALEEVMDVLDGLRSGGRVVGIVSHVAELRDRIPARLHVRKTRQGSTVALDIAT